MLWTPPCGCKVGCDFTKNTVNSVTPCAVHGDVTNESALDVLRQWCIDNQPVEEL